MNINDALVYADEFGNPWAPVDVDDALTSLATEVRRQAQEIADASGLRERLSALLTDTVNALRGPPPELVLWSWHDLPERAAAMAQEVERLTALAECRLAHIAEDRKQALARRDELADARAAIDAAMKDTP
jgi:hypothetical protein